MLTPGFDEKTEQHWWYCRACNTMSTLFFSDINMKVDAREHARECAKERSSLGG